MEENNFSNQAPQSQPGANAHQQFNNQFGQTLLPNSTAVLVLGILSIVFCSCYGVIGLVLGIIALVLSGKAKTIYDASPNNYTVSSFNNMKAGKICAIIGTVLSALMFLYMVVVVCFIGAAMSFMPWDQLMKH